MGRLFGTDGVRGIANKELTPELAFNLGKAGTFVLKKNAARPVIVIGKDTRVSGDMLENALTAGYQSRGHSDTGCCVSGKALQRGRRNRNQRLPQHFRVQRN